MVPPNPSRPAFDALEEVRLLLAEAMGIGARVASFDRSTLLLGAQPELDSMAALNLITALSERLGVMIHDDEIHADLFATVGSLADFVDRKMRS